MASGQRLSWWLLGGLEDSPDVFCGVAELAARDAGTKVKLADSYAVVFDVVGEVIVALGHGSNEDCSRCFEVRRCSRLRAQLLHRS
jgi:hypothetical protein